MRLRHRSVRRRAIASALAVALAAAALVGVAQPAFAAARVTVANADGRAVADPDYATEVTVTGAGFQSIKKGFGGIYVLFGWVDQGGWQPSKGGVVGADYRYVPDSETKDNHGFERFVAFPGSETAAAAQAIMGADGSWTVTMTIPGARFESADRDGKVSSVDCAKVTCGIITIGAHGVKNANNETFTPVSFVAPGAAAPGAGTPEPTAKPAAPATDARVGVAAPAVDAGNAIVFTGQGFEPGEQVVAALDDGVVAVGPLAVGAHGEVAGALSVPGDLRGGTHVLSLRGAASGSIAEAEVTVDAAASTVPPPAADTGAPLWTIVLLLLAVVVAAILVVVSVVSSWRRARARRRAKRATDAGDAGLLVDPPAPASAPTEIIGAGR